MPFRRGAVIRRKGKFFVVDLLMEREGTGKTYPTTYGTYVRESEARVHCWRLNRILICDKCDFKDDCVLGK